MAKLEVFILVSLENRKNYKYSTAAKLTSQHLRQRNNSKQIEHIILIFERTTVQRKVLIKQFNRILTKFCSNFNKII